VSSSHKRFSSLESKKSLPAQLKSALAKLNRFQNLEIGGAKPAPAAPPAGRTLCKHCGQANEEKRPHCWACFRPMGTFAEEARKPAPNQEIAIVLNGTAYTSSDPRTPPDVKVLMAWIRQEGYSEALLEKWQAWLKTRGQSAAAPQPEAAPPRPIENADRVEAFQGQRISVVRVDGKLYKSDDRDLPEEIKEIFGYIERDGVTPALLDHLRRHGTRVKYRPPTTPMPSDGDLDFWDNVKKVFGCDKNPPR
jgi:hypothetical protein